MQRTAVARPGWSGNLEGSFLGRGRMLGWRDAWVEGGNWTQREKSHRERGEKNCSEGKGELAQIRWWW